LLFDAQVSQSAAALDQLGQLRDQFGFQFVGSYLVNCEGFGEKWFKDRLGNWFALTPDGSLVRWDGKSFNSSARNVVATLSPLVFDDPDLLFRAQVNLSADALAAAAQLQEQFGFHLVGSLMENLLGFGEKWFQDQGGNWFALVPDGSLVPWDRRSFASSAQKTITHLDALFYDDPELLFNS
jgi:hypothetical protein